MKALVFDTGPLISLALNNLLWTLPKLKESFSGEFYITESVRKECIERPLESKKFKFEALQMLRLFEEGVLRLYTHDNLAAETEGLLELGNSLFKAHDNYVKNVHYAEMEAVAAALLIKANAVVVDEFITRTILERPEHVRKRMERKLHMRVQIDHEHLRLFKQRIAGIKVIRSVELITIGYEQGLFKHYILDLPHPRRTLLDGLLWALKLNGCSISELEINEILRLQKV